LQYILLVRKATFEDAEPADWDESICVIGFVRVAGKKPVLDALHKKQRRLTAVDVSIRCFFS
jgi:hypothetical protein